jgi:riboflavin kinase/FMN adenylyltransferase
MKQIEGIENIRTPFTRAVLTIGNFDGVHLGHQRLFNRVVETAHNINGTAAAMTFEPHPMKVIKPDGCPFPLITLYEQKMELLSKVGLDVLIVVPFTYEFSQISARQFVQNILVNRIGVKSIVIGNDYCFGKKREGNIQLLQEYGNEFGFSVQIVPWEAVDSLSQTRISSTAIRKAVASGNLKQARQMLGRSYQVRGTVQRGRNRGGSQVGFPTANLKLYDELKPLSGVYAVNVIYNDKRYSAVANIGYAPTFNDQEYTLEIHLIDFTGNLYDQTIRVNFIEHLREEIKFDSIGALTDQIKKDIQNARIILDTSQVNS